MLQAIDALGVELTPEMAMPLFAAIATDTGWFRFASVTAATLSAAARLAAAGAKPQRRLRALYEQNSLARLLLQGRILINVKSHLGGRLLRRRSRRRIYAKSAPKPTDTEDVINRLLSVAGVEAALLFLELGPQETKVSLRSRSTLDVNAIAAQLRRRRASRGLRRALSAARSPRRSPRW